MCFLHLIFDISREEAFLSPLRAGAADSAIRGIESPISLHVQYQLGCPLDINAGLVGGRDLKTFKYGY